MPAKINLQRCILMVITRGFNEEDAIHLISALREAGLCVKSLGMTSGLVSGQHGIYLMPDLTFSDLDDLARNSSISAVILPETRQCLTHLEADPRLHNFLRHVLSQSSQIVVNVEGRKFLKKISVWDPGLIRSSNGAEPLLLSRDQGQSIESLAQRIILRMSQPA